MDMTKPIKDSKKIKDILEVYDVDSKGHLLLLFGLYTGLRISDILRTQVKQIENDNWTGYEKKTGKRKQIKLNHKLLANLKWWIVINGLEGEDYIFFSDKNKSKPFSRTRADYYIRNAGEMIGLDRLSAHSLRKTFGYHAYKNGTPIPLLMRIFNHSSQSVTLRYIGIEQQDIDKVYTDISFDY